MRTMGDRVGIKLGGKSGRVRVHNFHLGDGEVEGQSVNVEAARTCDFTEEIKN